MNSNSIARRIHVIQESFDQGVSEASPITKIQNFDNETIAEFNV